MGPWVIKILNATNGFKQVLVVVLFLLKVNFDSYFTVTPVDVVDTMEKYTKDIKHQQTKMYLVCSIVEKNSTW